MYQYNFLCTYQELEDENEKDLCYKLQFLQAFSQENENEFNDKIITDITDKLYNELKDDNSFKILIKKLRDSMSERLSFINLLTSTEETTTSDSDIFCFVFSFDYFYKFHREYSRYKNNLDYNFDFIN